MRDLSEQAHYWVIQGEHDARWEGPVERRPASTGCGAVGRDWQLLVWPSQGRPDPEADVVHLTEGEAFGDLDVLALWLNIAPDGTVTSGEGVPEWWEDRDVQHCP